MVWLQKYEGYGARRDRLLQEVLTWFKLESTLFSRVRQNNRLFLGLSSILQPWFKICFVVFYREFTKLATGVSFFCTGSQCRRYGGARGAIPPNDCLCPPFWFIQNAFLEHRVTTRQQVIMEKGIIIFKHDSRVKFSRLFAILLATNCFT